MDSRNAPSSIPAGTLIVSRIAVRVSPAEPASAMARARNTLVGDRNTFRRCWPDVSCPSNWKPKAFCADAMAVLLFNNSL